MKRILGIGLVATIVAASIVPAAAAPKRWKPVVKGGLLCITDGTDSQQVVVWEISSPPSNPHKMRIVSQSAPEQQAFPADQSEVVKNRVVVFWKWKTVVNGHVVRHRRDGVGLGTVRLTGDCTPSTADNLVTYAVEGSGVFDVTYAQPNGTSQQTVTAPWSVNVPVLEADQFFYLSAQESNGTPTSFVCSITWQGDVIARAPAAGPFSICSVDESA